MARLFITVQTRLAPCRRAAYPFRPSHANYIRPAANDVSDRNLLLLLLISAEREDNGRGPAAPRSSPVTFLCRALALTRMRIPLILFVLLLQTKIQGPLIERLLVDVGDTISYRMRGRKGTHAYYLTTHGITLKVVFTPPPWSRSHSHAVGTVVSATG
ncbi:hypothetical protein BU24DRAFT_193927 [Aaosphaeria arxii CBS 175.79]|uniref:Uncharacterized protein n=1 Tax=Aaosphaeria arxii CBS 175.79 TaxID=1450172 RepID=A0A6A5XT31_9PLEO|nr:uncharacterized protein BU24DRAFT_193927 [Aaosphaeria arxii CBS 175.79]KAF2016103.1 hypothetical protein BU24DRAFT_193927 [Aaosphaeria arxii CBS 175.79]